MDEELSQEELSILMQAYKKELAQIYRAASLQRAALQREGAGQARIQACERAMRADIDELKRKYGIRY